MAVILQVRASSHVPVRTLKPSRSSRMWGSEMNIYIHMDIKYAIKICFMNIESFHMKIVHI